MSQIQNIENVDGCVSLYSPHSLYLKPLAKLSISVGLPTNRPLMTISNLSIMDKLSEELKPDRFFVLKVAKSTINYIRFEAELDNHKRLRMAIARLDGLGLKIMGFIDPFRVRCCEAKDEVPTRHDWDSYFRDARDMDEMKAGERPDTIHLSNLPIRWFCPRHVEHDDCPKPSESIFKRIFEKFGSVRCVDIPICDPFRKNMADFLSGFQTLRSDHETLFEGYVQFDEYSSFVRAMDQFRGMKLVRKFVDKNQAINITVTFDKTKHLSDALITKRDRIRKKLIEEASAEEDLRKKEQLLLDERLMREKTKLDEVKKADLAKQQEREDRRKQKHLKKIQQRGIEEISQKIRNEERKLMIAQRKLESIRILDELFNRITLKRAKTDGRTRNGYANNADETRERLVEKYKSATEELLISQRKVVDDVKSKTPLMGLLRAKPDVERMSSDESQDNGSIKHKAIVGEQGSKITELAMPNPAEMASEWMKSIAMLPYSMPSALAGMAAMYRPPYFPTGGGYRGGGFMPRRRGRGGHWRGRGRGAYEGGSHYGGGYDYERYDDEGDPREGSYKPNHFSRDRRSRSNSYSRSRSRSRGYTRRRSNSRSRSRSHYRRSAHKSRSRNRSRSKGRRNRKLVSTRRSYSSDSSSSSHSRTRKRSRSHRSKRSSGGGGDRRSHGHTPSPRRSHTPSQLITLATDDLVRSAEKIKTAIEKQTQDCMREEEREIKRTFNAKRCEISSKPSAMHRSKSPSAGTQTSTGNAV